MLKVILCTDGIFPESIGGMQRHSKLLSEYLAKSSEIELHVIHPHNPGIFDNKKVIEHSIIGIAAQKNYLLECYKYSKRVYEVLLQHPDAIVYSQGLSVWYGIRTLQNKIIVNPHGLESFQPFGRKDKILAVPFKIIFEYIFRNADFVVSLGGKLTQFLNNIVPYSKIRVISNGVANKPDNFPVFGDITNFVFVSRFAENKGIRQLVTAIHRLNELGWEDKLRFHLVGNGPLWDEINTNLKEKNVIIYGSVNDEELDRIYKNSQVMIFPTLFEGMPTVILEAMSYGLPIIASDVGAVSELVDGKNGFLIAPGSIDDIIEKILLFLKLPKESKILLSEHSIQKVRKQFLWDEIARKHVELFCQL